MSIAIDMQVHGSYSRLNVGQPSAALVDLIGRPCLNLPLQDEDVVQRLRWVDLRRVSVLPTYFGRLLDGLSSLPPSRHRDGGLWLEIKQRLTQVHR